MPGILTGEIAKLRNLVRAISFYNTMMDIYTVCQLHPVPDLRFPIDMVNMVFYCLCRDKKGLADLLIAVSFKQSGTNRAFCILLEQ